MKKAGASRQPAAPPPNPWLDRLRAAPPLRTLADMLACGRSAAVRGARGSSTAVLAALLAEARASTAPLLVVVGHLDEADDMLADWQGLAAAGMALRPARFPALESLPGDAGAAELFSERLALAAGLQTAARGRLWVAPIQALMQPLPETAALEAALLRLAPGARLEPAALATRLQQAGWQRREALDQPGDYALRGGILDLWPHAGTLRDAAGAPLPAGPLRLDFFGDELETLRLLDPGSLVPLAKAAEAEILLCEPQALAGASGASLLELLPADAPVLVLEPMEVQEQARGYFERLRSPIGILTPKSVQQRLERRPQLEVCQYSAPRRGRPLVEWPVGPLPPFPPEAAAAAGELRALAGTHAVQVLGVPEAEAARVRELVGQDDLALSSLALHRGFLWEGSLALVPWHEVIGRFETRRRAAPAAVAGLPGQGALELAAGDLVVHVDHGIARFVGLRELKSGRGGVEEFLSLEFANQVVMQVPLSEADRVQKYVGGFAGRPTLSTLGGPTWRKRKEEAGDAARDFAAELLRLQAARGAGGRPPCPRPGPWTKAFAAAFPFEETQDQLAAIAAIAKDMEAPKPMDRLLCGDVGFGKTEVAARAAFRAVEAGRQVAVLVPTTLLAEQHERTFRQRFSGFPFRIESLSRLTGGAETTALLADTKAGKVDVLIGTHRLLSGDIAFKNLGLIVVDEEQKFGVEHKQRLLALRLEADVLTMSATPIPRTLHMALVGLRDVSSLTTPPQDRRPVVTEVVPWNDDTLRQAIARELAREGQVFFVHNRVFDIDEVAQRVRALAPGARVGVGHGQMAPRELEAVMLAFYRGELDILVATTIIESGVDVPRANTLVIDDAHQYGLAQLHQLRGRVGRWKHRAYAYMLLPENHRPTDLAVKRLRAIENYSMLGAGFKIATEDLEIRGAGNLLGKEQSGHIAAVGYELYCLLLERETRRLKGEEVADPHLCRLEVALPGRLPKAWIPAERHRLSAYIRLARASTRAELAQVWKDLELAWGGAPAEAAAHFAAVELRLAASLAGLMRVRVDGPDLVLSVLSPKRAALAQRFRSAPGRTTELDDTTVLWRPPQDKWLNDPETLRAALRKVLVQGA